MLFASAEKSGVASVKEVSFSGLRLTANQRLLPGCVLTLSPLTAPGEQRGVKGRVCWTSAGQGPFELGVQLMDSPHQVSQTFVGDELAAREGRPSRIFQRRRTVRMAIRQAVRVGLAFSSQQDAELEDISLGGCALRCRQNWAVGMRLMVWAVLPTTPLVVSARVVGRRHDGLSCLKFENLSGWQERTLEDWIRTHQGRLEVPA